MTARVRIVVEELRDQPDGTSAFEEREDHVVPLRHDEDAYALGRAMATDAEKQLGIGRSLRKAARNSEGRR